MDSTRQLALLEAAVNLDRTLTQILGHLDLSREVPNREAIESLAQLLPSAITDVRERLIGRADQTEIEYVEATLRARAAVVMMGLDDLRAAEHELGWTPLENAGRFQSVAELSRALAERIGRINASLARKRRDLGGIVIDGWRSQALFRVALGNAEYGYAALGSDPHVLAFLCARAACDSARVRFACHTIACALDSSIAGERPMHQPRALRAQRASR